MSKIKEVFSSFLKPGKIFGYYPFNMDNNYKVKCSFFGKIHSMLILICIYVFFGFFVNGTELIKEQGSDLSQISGIVSTLLITVITSAIILNNFINDDTFKNMFGSFWTIDLKVK